MIVQNQQKDILVFMTVDNLEKLILYRDPHLLAAAKPAGLETRSQSGRQCFSALMRRGLGISTLAPVHRLDRDTTGVQLFAITKTARATLEKSFRERVVGKQYLAICLGVPANPEGTIRRNLSAWKSGRQPVRVIKGKEGKGLTAETSYFCLCDNGDVSLILFTPKQGRTHQIRVHAQAIKHPILGDDQYGDRPANRTAKSETGLARQALHAWRIVLPHPVTGKELRIESPLPADMCIAADSCFSGSEWKTRVEAVVWFDPQA